MKTLTVAELKAHFSEVLGQMAADDQPVAISYGRRKEKVAALVPYRMVAAPGPRALGVLQGRARFKLREDFALSDDELLGA